MKESPLRLHGDPRASALSVLLVISCAFLVSTEGCKKDDTVDGPDTDGTPTTPVLNRILLSARDSSWTGGMQLCTMNSDGSGFRRLTSPAESITYLNAVWSPDARHLAVIWNYADMRRAEYPFLSLADTSGKLLTLLASLCEHPSQIVWSPDGTQIAFSHVPSVQGGNPEIYLVNAAGGTPQKLTHFRQTGISDTSSFVYGWASSGTTLLTILQFGNPQARTGVLSQLDLTGTPMRTIFQDAAKVPIQADAVGSRTVCQYARYGAIFGLLAIDSSDTIAHALRPELFYQQTWQLYQGLALSPDGKSLCFAVYADNPSFVGPRQAQVYAIDLATGAEHAILSMNNARVCDWR